MIQSNYATTTSSNINYTINTSTGNAFTYNGQVNLNVWEYLKNQITPEMLLEYIGKEKLLDYLDLDYEALNIERVVEE